MAVQVNFATPVVIKGILNSRLPEKYVVRGSLMLYLKAGILISCLVCGYSGLVFFSSETVARIGFGLLTALSATGIVFNIGHDGVHESFSEKRWGNHLAASTFDVLGVSSYFWGRKHRLSHHVYTNIAHKDEDIHLGKIARFAEEQPWFWWHQYQHIYLWLLYAFVHIRYVYIDLQTMITGKKDGLKVVTPRGVELFIFLIGRIVFLCVAFVVPMVFHPWYGVIGYYVVISMTIGTIAGIVFQLAHSIDIVDHPRETNLNNMPEWAVSQIQTTANFTPRNPVLTCFLGGLNYQTEHHLYPRTAHVYYPVLSKIVKQVCTENQITYHENMTLVAALKSHYRFIRKMGECPC